MLVTTINVEPELNAGLRWLTSKLYKSESVIINQAIRDYIEPVRVLIY